MNFADYEKLVQAVVRDFKMTDHVEVFHQREFVGKRSGRTIRIDVSFEMEMRGIKVLFLVECKYYNHKVDVSEIEEFRTKMDDIGAHKGIVFTSVGFQDGAVKVARAYGIGLARLSAKPHDGDILVMANSLEPRLPPKEISAGEVLSGALFNEEFEGWHWFWNSRRLVNMLFCVAHLSQTEPKRNRKKGVS